MKKSRLAAASLILLATACAQKQAAPMRSTDATRLHAAVTEYADAVKRLDPFNAPYYNVEEDLDKFGDYPTPSYYTRSEGIYRAALAKLATVNSAGLSPDDSLLYRLFKEDMEISVQQFSFPDRYLEFTQMDNRLHSYLDDSSEKLTSFPFDTPAHYRAFAKRSEGFPAYVEHQIALFREGIQKHFVLSCVAVESTLKTYSDGLEANTEKNPFYRPINFMPKSFTDHDRAELSREFKKMVDERIVPGFRKFDVFFRKEYLPRCRHSFGIRNFPNSQAWYAYRIHANTSLPLSAKEIHATGLAEVARISAEIDHIKIAQGFHGSLNDFMKSLAHDPKYFFTSAKDMFDAFLRVKAATAEKIPAFFRLIPKSEYRIVESSNPEDAAGRYGTVTEIIPYGRFIVNTKNIRSVPIYDVTTLLLHEAVPGHHFQLALKFEMKDRLSEYQRKVFSSNAFEEGWALYSEYLGKEMGMYGDPIQRLGNLNDEMLRAVRLVVDTGIHAFGWTRPRTVAYMRDHLALDAKDIDNEANRYSVWPGQALGYKIGQLKIIALRRLAEKELGPKFDIREFHRVVIGNGSVSLSVLETQVKDWITSLKAR